MLPILPGDIKVDLGPGRLPELPDIYRTPHHPLWKSEGNIYYFFQDLSEAGMKRSGELERRLRIPHGPESRAVDKGAHHWGIWKRPYGPVWDKLLMIVIQGFSN